MRQCELLQEPGLKPRRFLACWLPISLARVGTMVVLRDGEEVWRVDRVYRQTISADQLVKPSRILALFILAGQIACATVPDPSPSPSPSVTPAPSPIPTPTTTPTPPPPCGLPAPQEKFDSRSAGPSYVTLVDVAVSLVMQDNPSRFEVSPTNELAAWLLKLDGTRARHDEPGSHDARVWFHERVVAQLQKYGVRVGSFGTDEVVVCPRNSTGPCGTLSIVAHSTGFVLRPPEE